MAIDRMGSALLITGALLLGPYAASNSVLTPFAIGVIPLFQKRPLLGLILTVFFFFPFLKLGDTLWRMNMESNYWSFVLVLSFGVILLSELNSAHKQKQEAA